MGRTKTEQIISHVAEHVHYSPSKCPWHFNHSCFLLLNNFNERKFHALYANQAIVWKSYTLDQSCTIPEGYYDMMHLNREFGSRYVLKFVTDFRERSGYTIGLFEIQPHLYSPRILKPAYLGETFYTMLVLFCAACRQFGGNPPVLKFMSFIYRQTHPVLADIGSTEHRERLGRMDYVNEKKWSRFLKKRTTREILRYLRLVHPDFFKKKCSPRSRCILSEEVYFDDETHALVCKSQKLNIRTVLQNFQHLMPCDNVRASVNTWLRKLAEREELENQRN